jgi:phosphinothricin acetyltransferase
MRIRSVDPSDAEEIARIYNHYIANSHATFELELLEAHDIEVRINEALEGNFPYLVWEADGHIFGYAYGRQFRPRPAYKRSIETSVYVEQGGEGKGIGTSLYKALLTEIRDRDFHTIIAGISLPNDASVRLHEKFGFEKVAHFCEVGFKFDRWIDVGYWQLFLDRTAAN